MKAKVILNAAAGSEDAAATREQVTRVVEAFSAASVAVEIDLVHQSQLSEAVRTATSTAMDVVVVGGGDGSVSTAAAVLAGGKMPLGVLPLGTQNHFAKDLGLPLALDQAAQTIARGQEREVIGLYAWAVERREERQERHGWRKWSAMTHAALTVAREFPLFRLRIRADERVMAVTTPFVFVGSNRYEMSLFSMGARSCLDGGELNLYVAKTSGRLGFVGLLLRALVGRLDQAQDFESMCPSMVDIDADRPTLRVARDGEVARMGQPLRYRVRPRALRVMAPSH